jgi:hypothetical protein
MSWKLKQENFNKPVTAEALKVLKLVANQVNGRLELPELTADTLMVNPGLVRRLESIHGSTGLRRCYFTSCFCALTRLQANIIIRYQLTTYPEKRDSLRQWREQRKAQREQRRVNRNVASQFNEAADTRRTIQF